MQALSITVKQPWWQNLATRLASLKVAELLVAATQMGQHRTMKSLLRNQAVPQTVKTLATTLDAVQKNIPYTTAYRQTFRSRFLALRVYDGASTFFWTLNPADVRHELILVFASGDSFAKRSFSLNWTDSEKAMYWRNMAPLTMHTIVAADPRAVVKMFYTFISLTLTQLCHCSCGPKHLPPNGIAGHEEPGLLGIVSSYAGAVEPQARKSLHWHALFNILGCRNPEELRTRLLGDFDKTVKRLWAGIASIHFGSTEAVAPHLDGHEF